MGSTYVNTRHKGNQSRNIPLGSWRRVPASDRGGEGQRVPGSSAALARIAPGCSQALPLQPYKYQHYS